MTTDTLDPAPGRRSAETTLALPPVEVPPADAEDRDGSAPQPRGLAPALLALFAAQAVVVLDLDVPVLRPVIALGTMLVLPSWVLYRRAGWRSDSLAARAAYAVGLNVLALMLVGLLVSLVGPLVGADRVLTPQVLGVAWLVLDVVLLAWRPWIPLLGRTEPGDLLRRAWAAPVEPAQLLALAALPLAVVGALRLNNGAGGEVALAAHVLAVLALAGLLVRRGTAGRDLRVVYLTALTFLLATSLRGWGITGHDVQAEFAVYTLTAQAQHWSMDLAQNAYNACLSITVLPVVLAETTGLSGTTWFKVGLQVGFAAVPVIALLAFRRLLGRRLALVATAFVVAFPTFHVDMPYLVRQEVAFLFLALVLLAATDRAMPVPTRRGLVAVFGVGMVLSHYSTTYLLLTGLVGGLALYGLATVVARRRGRAGDRRSPLVLLHPAVVAVLVAASLLWTGPVTDTGSHPLTVAQEAIESLVDGDGGPGSNDRRFWLLGGQEDDARARLDRYVADTMEVRADYPRRLAVFTDPGPALTEPEIVPEDEAPTTPLGDALASVGVDPGTLVVALRNGSALLLQVLLLAGVVWVVRAGASAARSRASRVGLETVCVVLGLMGALGLVVLVPSLSVEYGVLRAFLQTLLFLAPVAALGLWWAASRLPRGGMALLVAVPVVLLAVLTSAGTALVGGGPAKLALANAGIYHDRYVVDDSDVVAAQWVAGARDTSGPLPKVLASTSMSTRLALAGVPVEEVHGRTFPTLLNVGSYVFANARMAAGRKDTLFLDGDRVTYRYPVRQLGRRLHLVYSAGDSRVYR